MTSAEEMPYVNINKISRRIKHEERKEKKNTHIRRKRGRERAKVV